MIVDTDLFKTIKRIEIVSKHLVENALSGNYLSTFHGQGLEFSEVREYQPGDEVRMIDWNVTARMGQAFVKVMQEEREMTVILAVDLSASTDFGSRGIAKRELAAQAAAALGFAAALNGDRVGALFFTDGVEKVLPPKRGRTHVLRAVRDLLSIEPKGRGTDFAPALNRIKSVAPRKATVFLISDFQAPGLEAAARAASRRYDLIACRLSDPAESKVPAGLGMLPCRDPETGKGFWLDTDSPFARGRWKRRGEAARLETEKALRRLKVDHFDLATDGDLMPPLVRFFKMREKRLLRV